MLNFLPEHTPTTLPCTASQPDCSQMTAGAWNLIDFRPLGVPYGATGLYFYVQNNNGTAITVGARKNGSTDARTNTLGAGNSTFISMGLDIDGRMEFYTSDASLNVILMPVAWYDSMAVFFTNAIDKSAASAASWQDLDCSTECPNALALIAECYGASTAYNRGFRQKGCADAILGVSSAYNGFGAIIPVDQATHLSEQYIANLAQKTYVVGYIIDGVSFDAAATALTPTVANKFMGETGGYYPGATIDIMFATCSAVSTQYQFYIYSSNGNDGLIWHNVGRNYLMLPKGANELILSKIANITYQKLYWIGAVTPPTLSPAFDDYSLVDANQTQFSPDQHPPRMGSLI